MEQEDSGIYYLIGDAISIQLVIVPKLSKEHNYWLNNLRNDLKAGSEIKKITESGLKSIDNTTITHSSVGDFTYNPKTGAVSKMKGGGHGQANIEFLEANGLEYNIVKVYDNGVRVGVIRTNGRISTIFPDAASQPQNIRRHIMIKNIMDDIISERKSKNIEDDYGIQNCWNKMIDILSKDINETVAYLENCSEEDIYFISEVFEDVSEQLQSKEYIECLRKLDDKFPNLDMTKDIDLVEEYI